MGQGQRSRSSFWCAVIDTRVSALLSAAKKNKSHSQSKVFVCGSVIIGRMRIIMRVRLKVNGFYEEKTYLRSFIILVES